MATQGQANRPSQRVIGLTGGIGMGKTTISNYLATAYQLPILDADIYARDAVAPGSALVQEIGERYGSNVLLPNGDLNRVRLGEIVFSCQTELHWLEKRIHPYVRDRIQSELSGLDPITYPTVVLVIPLLFEARMTDLVTEIWVVQCERSRQINRLQERDTSGLLTLEQIHDRINSQMPIEEKLRRADIIIDNNSTLEALFHNIDQAIHIEISSHKNP
ncbi:MULTISPECIES: dephospho-CoA kinase [unclassified Leptolyngbya]|uniref:dephospho-CoA kinase n=1 Tax=unclassified Leptolyngbya TaxID=2650499 RepID=UPI001689C490|nr:MULTISPECIES: dephospho-CoA kinase [unclassified Leptolyngbya]MBD1912776.1 dephospho-CoA kinase [Leptolyngbya sp. FACHB-8]MBD2157723.1 dephospho-CoA kinase [Leptolyngbya sp. FACHB-16]